MMIRFLSFESIALEARAVARRFPTLGFPTTVLYGMNEVERHASHAQTMSQVTQPLFPVVSSRP